MTLCAFKKSLAEVKDRATHRENIGFWPLEIMILKNLIKISSRFLHHVYIFYVAKEKIIFSIDF
jgi:hypothetical protein